MTGWLSIDGHRTVAAWTQQISKIHSRNQLIVPFVIGNDWLFPSLRHLWSGEWSLSTLYYKTNSKLNLTNTLSLCGLQKMSMRKKGSLKEEVK